MPKSIKTLILAVFVAGSAAFAGSAHASTPIFSATYQGGGSQNAQISISNANSFSQINLSYRQSSSLWTVVNNIGQTDQNGYFSQSVSLPSDGTASPIQLYVTVGGLQSSTISVYAGGYSGGCTYNCGNSYGLSLSQNSLSLSAGQSASVTATNSYAYGYGSNIYVSSNSNSSVATASVSGNQITVYGVSSGSTNISVCSNSGSNGCATLYVTVSGYNTGGCGYYGCGIGNLTLSQTSLSLSVGQSSTVTVSGNAYSGSFYISSNSNSSVVSASLSGSQISVYALAAGSSTISVCQSGYANSCVSLYVTVTGVLGANTNLWFNPGSASLYVGQSLAVSINSSSYSLNSYYGSSQYYYVSSNSNSSVISASVSGTVLNLYANQSGYSTISVCSSALGFCGTINVTVTGGSSSGSLSLSQTSLNLNAGQSSNVTIYGSGSYYISSNSNSSVVSASVSGSTLYLNGLTSGSSTVTVCQSSYSSQCGSVYVTVSGYSGGSSIWFSPSTANLNLAQSMTVAISGSNNYYANNYYISSNSNSVVVTASISGNNLYLYGNGVGNSSIVVCQSGYGNCGTLYVTVGNSNYYGSNISLSQSSINMSLYQTSSVTIYGSGSYYISSNSNAAVVSASVSSNSLTLYANSTGSTTVVVCQSSSNSCANLYVTVGGNNSSNIILSQYSLSLSVGQNATVNVSGAGGYGYYISSNSNPGVISASFNGSVITVYAIANGSSTLQICQNNAGSCQSLYVTVGGGYFYGGGGLPYQGGSSVLGASTYASGQLISEGQTVYIVYKNSKTAFASAFAFMGLGFSFNNVLQVGSSGLANSGFTVTTPYAQHPWGSWIKSGNTVYFVHETGLIPVPDWSTFLSNDGQAGFIVKANSYDFKLPVLPTMTMNDSRMQ